MTLGDRIVVMSNGLIQQAGPPLEVYHRPANRFVAAFVGMPPMNFLQGEIRRGASGLAFVEAGEGGQTLACPESRRSALEPLTGKPLVLGIRPQMFSFGVNVPGSTPLRVRSNVVEPLGDTIDIACATANHPGLVARLPSRAGITAGHEVTLAVDMNEVHFFEPGEFGRNIAPGHGA